MLFVDNDALEKMAVLDIISEVTTPGVQVSVLPTLKFRVRKRTLKNWGQDVADRMLAFIDACPTVALPPDTERFVGIDAIDEGEVLLLAATVATDGSVLWTGDKRCLCALSMAPNLGDIVTALSGRVVCFEQLILRLITARGFAFVHNKVLSRANLARSCDTALEAAFGSGSRTTEDSAVNTLRAYVESLRAETCGLLAP